MKIVSLLCLRGWDKNTINTVKVLWVFPLRVIQNTGLGGAPVCLFPQLGSSHWVSLFFTSTDVVLRTESFLSRLSSKYRTAAHLEEELGLKKRRGMDLGVPRLPAAFAFHTADSTPPARW